jgi:Ca2+-transporting ATPase
MPATDAGGGPAPVETDGWHTRSVDEVLQALGTSRQGLASDEAERRLREHGANELHATSSSSAWRTLAAQFRNVLILILLGATGVSALLGHTLEATVITIIVSFAVLLGFVQEHRAERALAALRQMAAPTAHAVRNGAEIALAARDVVPGDIVLLRAGDRVPADGRLVEAISLAVDESTLTGESTAADKTVEPLAGASLPLGDRTNMVYAGTLTAYGRGQAVAVATGMATEFGRITRMVETVEAGRTPLQENLDKLGATLGKAALVIVGLVVVTGLARGLPVIEMFMFGIALAVAVVPEALPAVVTISLAIGVRRMVARHALVRRLPVVETLGSTSVICSDKTGTLTRNEMTVRRVVLHGYTLDVTGAGYEPHGEMRVDGADVTPSAAARDLLHAASLASDAHLAHRDGRWTVEGDPTEGALLVAAAKAGLTLDEIDREAVRVDEIPFTSERRQMTTLHRTPDGIMACSKGATDRVLACCTTELREGETQPLTETDRDRVRADEHRLASEGLRVLAVARKRDATRDDAERDMTLLGLVAMMDPPRDEASAAVARCRSAGIVPIMITGDHPLTAQTIARELGILSEQRSVSGAELERMSDEELRRDVQGIGVYARVSPADKLRVVEAWQHHGHVVAMTGDGVNDAPALKKADVGIAMGVTGTDVSKEAAGMTLLDDNFATIVAAVEEGRIVFGNIKKYLMYLLSCNVGEIGLLAGAVMAGLPLPLTAVQILYVNLATDGLPALALAVDPPEPDLMARQPRDPRRGVFTRAVTTQLVVAGVWSALVNLGLFIAGHRAGRPLEQVMALTFVTLVLIQFFNAYNCRSDRLSVVRRPFANRWLNAAVAWEVALLVAIVTVPMLQQAFGTFTLSASDWALTIALAATIVPVVEIVKAMARRQWLGPLA